MGKIVINQTDEKQTVILSTDDAEIRGGYYDADGLWHELGDRVNPIDYMAEGNPVGEVVCNTETIADYAFMHKVGLTKFSAPNCTKVKARAFNECANLVEIEFPNLEKCEGDYNFTSTKITEVSLPKYNSAMTVRMFGSCTSLVTADMGLCTGLPNQSFFGCTALRNLILRSSSVAKNEGWNANNFSGMYNNPSQSTLYVPSALVDSYKTATGWSSGVTAGLTITAIEGSEYE